MTRTLAYILGSHTIQHGTLCIWAFCSLDHCEELPLYVCCVTGSCFLSVSYSEGSVSFQLYLASLTHTGTDIFTKYNLFGLFVPTNNIQFPSFKFTKAIEQGDYGFVPTISLFLYLGKEKFLHIACEEGRGQEKFMATVCPF